MILTILGVILLLVPFGGIFYFKNRILGFVYIFTGLGLFHLFLSLTLQASHLFTYPIVLGANVLLALVFLIFLFIKRQDFSFNIVFDWRILAAAAIIFFELFSVHYLYTGLITSFKGHQNVINNSYSYPYFSDEWAGVALTKYSITENALPIVNPFLGSGYYPFPNIFVGFFAGLAEIFLLINLDPLVAYPIISLVSGALVCLFVYLFLKSGGLDKFFSLTGALSIPLITNSGNLPGIWFLFPFIGGTIFFLVSLIFFNLKQEKWAFLSILISLFIYPPLVVMAAPAVMIWLLSTKDKPVKKYLKIFLFAIVPVLLVTFFIFIFQRDNAQYLFTFFKNSLIRLNNDGCIPARGIWNVVPIILLPFSIIGIIHLYKRKVFYFLVPLGISLLYWVVYAYSPYFFIIDYARIVAFSSYLIVIASSWGLYKAFTWTSGKYDFLQKKETRLALEIIIFLIFLIISFSYTQRTNWTKIVLQYDTAMGLWQRPTNPPATMYLSEDDLRLFEGLRGERFLSPEWKGLVIGAATGNYPLESKASIIANFDMRYNEFILQDCGLKELSAKKNGLDYVYSSPFNCFAFKYVGKSREGLYLYKFQP